MRWHLAPHISVLITISIYTAGEASAKAQAPAVIDPNFATFEAYEAYEAERHPLLDIVSPKPKVDRSLSSLPIPANYQYIRWYGRVRENEDDSVSFDWAGVRIQFYVTKTTYLNAIMDQESSRGNIFRLLVDNKEVMRFHSDRDNHENKLLSGLDPNKKYLVELYKDSGPKGHTREKAWTTLYGFEANTGVTVSAPTKQTRRIEFIGDSITAGYGTMVGASNDARCDNTHEVIWSFSNWEAYSGRLCRTFNADCRMTAYRGAGLIYNSDFTVAPKTIPHIARRTLATDEDEEDHDFASWVPELVFINIGQNDMGQMRRVDFREQFIEALGGLAAEIFTLYRGRAKMILGAGTMWGTPTYAPLVEQAVKNLRNDKITFVNLLNDDIENDGCQAHPSSPDNAIMHNIARNAIHCATGWGACVPHEEVTFGEDDDDPPTPLPSSSTSNSPSPAGTPSRSPSRSRPPSDSPTRTPTVTRTPSLKAPPSESNSNTPTASLVPSPTRSPTRTTSPAPPSVSAAPSISAAPSLSSSMSNVPSGASPSRTPIAIVDGVDGVDGVLNPADPGVTGPGESGGTASIMIVVVCGLLAIVAIIVVGGVLYKRRTVVSQSSPTTLQRRAQSLSRYDSSRRGAQPLGSVVVDGGMEMSRLQSYTSRQEASHIGPYEESPDEQYWERKAKNPKDRRKDRQRPTETTRSSHRSRGHTKTRSARRERVQRMSCGGDDSSKQQPPAQPSAQPSSSSSSSSSSRKQSSHSDNQRRSASRSGRRSSSPRQQKQRRDSSEKERLRGAHRDASSREKKASRGTPDMRRVPSPMDRRRERRRSQSRTRSRSASPRRGHRSGALAAVAAAVVSAMPTSSTPVPSDGRGGGGITRSGSARPASRIAARVANPTPDNSGVGRLAVFNEELRRARSQLAKKGRQQDGLRPVSPSAAVRADRVASPSRNLARRAVSPRAGSPRAGGAPRGATAVHRSTDERATPAAGVGISATLAARALVASPRSRPASTAVLPKRTQPLSSHGPRGQPPALYALGPHRDISSPTSDEDVPGHRYFPTNDGADDDDESELAAVEAREHRSSPLRMLTRNRSGDERPSSSRRNR